jgi:glycosyltransferase involved in cell wall biosynthesis
MEIKSLDIEFEIIGDGEREYVHALQEMTLSNPRIYWLGNIDGEEKNRHLANADLLVLPSFTENFGNVVFEALSVGTAVLLSDQVGGKDYVLNQNLGWVLPLDKLTWQKTLQEIYSSTEKRKDIRHRAPVIVQRDFNKESLARQYVTMYEQHIMHFNLQPGTQNMYSN